MELNSFLRDIVVIFGAALLVSTACRLLKIPSLVGLLLTGCVVGPFGAGLIHQPGNVEMIAELGVVFLLFEIGLELSIKRLRRIGRLFFAGGTMQASSTIAITLGIALLFGYRPLQALFFGLVLSLSSTAIVLRLYNDNREMETPHGGIALGILLFQDILIVPFLLIVPLLGGSHESFTFQFLIRFLTGCAIIAATSAGPALSGKHTGQGTAGHRFALFVPRHRPGDPALRLFTRAGRVPRRHSYLRIRLPSSGHR
jgi:CPA2 family monovalent cation:H+ antiporter-2